MDRGWIKLWRKLEDWSWRKDPLTSHLFINLLLMANHKPYEFMGFKINRGQVVTGRFKLAETLGLTEQNIKTSFYKLKSTNEITIKSTNRFSIVSIVNYEIYQSESTSKLTSKSNNNQTTTNQQLTTIKECKNDKNDKNKAREATPQTRDQAKSFFKELGFESLAEEFFDFYASKGWVVGRAPMKDWKCAAKRWCRNQKNYQKKPGIRTLQDMRDTANEIKQEMESWSMKPSLLK